MLLPLPHPHHLILLYSRGQLSPSVAQDRARLFQTQLLAEKKQRRVRYFEARLESLAYLHLDNEIAALFLDSTLDGFDGTFQTFDGSIL